MQIPLLPTNETERLRHLKDYNILDTMQETEYDDITRIASQICQTPISLISLIDDKRQWFKSRFGLDTLETAKEISFCGHAVHNNNILVVPDAREDERFFDNPMTTGSPHVIFYTGVPLVSNEGFVLGTLCVIDHTPRILDEHQMESLKALSNQRMKLLELRKKTAQLEFLNKKLDAQNVELERFAYVAAHDIKSPLTSINGLSKIIIDEYNTVLNADVQNIVGYIHKTSNDLIKLVSGILEHSKNENALQQHKDLIELDVFFKDLVYITNPENKYQIHHPHTNATLFVNKTGLKQIFLNLISNSIKYNSKEAVQIDISFSEDEKKYIFEVRDNGNGIEVAELKHIFDIFYAGALKDRFGFKGFGIGLSTVKKTVEALGGTITIQSKLNTGTTFTFSVAKGKQIDTSNFN